MGSSAFAHKGGVHASAAARLPAAYEHVDPASVGNHARVVVSELAGRASLTMKAAELGIDLSAEQEQVAAALDAIKELEYRGYSFEAADGSLSVMLKKRLGTYEPSFELESFRVIAEKREDGRVATEATIKVHVGGHRYIAMAEGNGPVNALDKALRTAIGRFYPRLAEISLEDYKVRVLDESKGTGAVTRVLIESTDGEKQLGDGRRVGEHHRSLVGGARGLDRLRTFDPRGLDSPPASDFVLRCTSQETGRSVVEA